MKKNQLMSDTYLPGDTRQRIQDLIKSRKITQAELAERVGLSSSTLSRYLQGRTMNLGDGFIIRIAKYFDVSTDFLLGETDIPDRKNYDIRVCRVSGRIIKSHTVAVADGNRIAGFHQPFPPPRSDKKTISSTTPVSRFR